jgi:ribose transport system substrate-binding protein
MKRLSVLMLVLAMLLTACATPATPANDAPASAPAAKVYKIGFSHINLNMAWMAEVNTLVAKKAKELGVELIATNADNNKQKQITDVENLLAQGIDGLLLAPVDGSAVVPAIEMANKAGVPVVVVIRGTPSTDIVSFITGDDISAGQQSAQFIIDKLGGKGNVVELVGALGATPFINRSKGFNEVMAKNPNVKIVAQQNAESLRAKAVSVMESIITANPVIDAVFGANDEMALGAYEALKAANKAEGVKIVTVGGHMETYTAIKEGRLFACIAYPTTMGPRGLEVLLDHLNGKSVQAKEVVPVSIITKENVQKYIDAAK